MKIRKVLFVLVFSFLMLFLTNGKVYAIKAGERTMVRCPICSKSVNAYVMYVKQPTCEVNGVMRCEHPIEGAIGHQWSEPIQKLGHSYDYTGKEKAATCEREGFREKACIRCGVKKLEKIPAKGHNWQIDLSKTIYSTCTKTGERVSICKNCGVSKTETISKVQHAMVNGVCRICGYGSSNTSGGSTGGGTSSGGTQQQNKHVCTFDYKVSASDNKKCILTCTGCGATKGTASTHKYSNGICTKCGYIEETHNFQNGTCANCGLSETAVTWDSLKTTGVDLSKQQNGSIIAKVNDEGILTIEGTGDMKHWGNPASPTDEFPLNPLNCVRSKIKKVEIKGGINYIPTYMFFYFANVTSVTFDENAASTITSIGECSFMGCKKLTSITLPGTVEQIGARAFCHVHDLKNINLSENTALIRIGHEAFRDCWQLKTVKLPEGLKVIGYEAFFNCIALQNLVLPKSVSAIGTYGKQTDETGIGTTADPNRPVNTSGINNVFTIDFSRNTQGIAEEDKNAIIVEYSSYIDLLLAQRGITSTTEVTDSTTAATALSELLTETKVWYYAPKDHEVCCAQDYKAQRASTEMIITATSWDISKNGDGRVTATLNKDGKLTIEGIGETKDFEIEQSPWNPIREYVKEVEIKEGITALGAYTFYWNNNLAKVALPSTLKVINYGAFFGDLKLTDITLPNGI